MYIYECIKTLCLHSRSTRSGEVWGFTTDGHSSRAGKTLIQSLLAQQPDYFQHRSPPGNLPNCPTKIAVFHVMNKVTIAVDVYMCMYKQIHTHAHSNIKISTIPLSIYICIHIYIYIYTESVTLEARFCVVRKKLTF